MASEKLIPVKSDSELRVGMKVKLKNSLFDGKSQFGILLNPEKESECCYCHSRCVSFRWTGRGRGLRICRCIPEGRLFRVDDGMDAEFASDRREIYRAILERAAQTRVR